MFCSQHLYRFTTLRNLHCHTASPQALLFPHLLKRVPATMHQNWRTDSLPVCVSIGREIRPIDTTASPKKRLPTIQSARRCPAFFVV